MTRFLEPYSECIHDTVRIVAGYCFMLHGLMKFGLIGGGQPVELASLLGLAAIIETVGGALITVGLFTKPVAFIASGEMAAAYFIGHGGARGVAAAAAGQPRRAGGALLLPVPVPRLAGSRRLERRRRDGQEPRGGIRVGPAARGGPHWRSCQA